MISIIIVVVAVFAVLVIGAKIFDEWDIRR